MNAVCTIVAKNYLSQARSLGDSLKKTNPDLPFHILLADETEGLIDICKEKYDIIEFKNIGVSFYKEMAFKYNVLEFCTATKPFFLEYLFNKYNYDKIIYFDPDIFVYNKLDSIFNELDENFIVLTPHFVNHELNYSGAFSEEELLFVGIYNLGFVALNNSCEAKKVIEWWKIRLKDKCYADKMDALHVDQKWMDFLPSLYDKGVKITRNTGYNVALWNLQERSLVIRDGVYYIKNTFGNNDEYPLVFFHFSGFNPNKTEEMCRKQKKYNLTNRAEFSGIFNEYSETMLKNGYNELVNYTYVYDKYYNGICITQFQRRMYRMLLENGKDFSDPFETETGSFYELLKKNNLIVKEKDNSYNKITQFTYSNIGKKIRIMTRVLKFIKVILGTKNYFLLMKFLYKYSKIENQLFLIRRN